tara:strand:+ start:896 stop:1714 length:819 start_codon:yes stop_codon:yes gene_type:complete
MASTYTNNTGIEQPGSGEQAGSWGTTVNRNFNIIDAGLHGQVEKAVTGSFDLTTTDGAVSDGQHTVIILTGTPGSTFEMSVTPINQEKHFTVKNDTDSACRVIYKGVSYSANTGVEIASGATQAVTGDGTKNGATSGIFKNLTPPTDLVNDSSPQLGANLDVQTHSIVSTSNRNIAITPNGSGKVVLDGLSYPAADGTNGQYLQTDGSGTLSFSTVPISGSTFNLGDWTLSVVNNELVFSYTTGGTTTAVAKIGTNGAITSEGDITAFGSLP